MKTIHVRVFRDDIPDLTRLRLQLSLSRGRDVSTAEAIRWLLSLELAQRVIKGDGSQSTQAE